MTLQQDVSVQTAVDAIRKTPQQRVSTVSIDSSHVPAIKRDGLKRLTDDLTKQSARSDLLVVVISDPKLTR